MKSKSKAKVVDVVIVVPKSLRSKLGFCERGQMGGYKVRTIQLLKFAAIIGRKMIDEVIPLDEPTQADPALCHVHEGEDAMDNLVYWETEDGSHGWCCKECGTVNYPRLKS